MVFESSNTKHAYSVCESSKTPKNQRPTLGFVSNAIITQKKINIVNKPTLALFNLKQKTKGKKINEISNKANRTHGKMDVP